MFASRLRRAASFLVGESSQESSDRDTRSVEEVLDAANRALGALWTMFTSQTSPWAMMVAFLLGYAILIYLISITNAALATHMIPLEFWHMGQGQRASLRYFHTPWHFKLMSREAIKPAAIKRAAELRQKMGLEPLPLARVEQAPARRHTARVADGA